MRRLVPKRRWRSPVRDPVRGPSREIQPCLSAVGERERERRWLWGGEGEAGSGGRERAPALRKREERGGERGAPPTLPGETGERCGLREIEREEW